jgi:NMD protein affecting ribosome stability and mRNA decay
MDTKAQSVRLSELAAQPDERMVDMIVRMLRLFHIVMCTSRENLETGQEWMRTEMEIYQERLEAEVKTSQEETKATDTAVREKSEAVLELVEASRGERKVCRKCRRPLR